MRERFFREGVVCAGEREKQTSVTKKKEIL